MNRLLAFIILTGLSTLLHGCSETQPRQIKLELKAPQLSRAVDASNVIAYVTIDSGPAARVTFDNASSKTVIVDNINPNQRHNYTVAWHEWIDGVELVLSRQNGELTVTPDNPTANLNSDHITSFDSDGDGIENLTERKAGSCPWVRCDANGFLVNPADVLNVLLSNGENVTYQGSSQWQESNAAAGQSAFQWRTLRNTRSSVFLEDLSRCNVCEPYRGFLMELDFANGDVLFNYNETASEEYIKIYGIQDVTL